MAPVLGRAVCCIVKLCNLSNFSFLLPGPGPRTAAGSERRNPSMGRIVWPAIVSLLVLFAAQSRCLGKDGLRGKHSQHAGNLPRCAGAATPESLATSASGLASFPGAPPHGVLTLRGGGTHDGKRKKAKKAGQKETVRIEKAKAREAVLNK